MSEIVTPDPRYKYAKQRAKILTPEMLSGMIALVLDPDKSWWKSALNGVKLVAAWCFIACMKSLERDAAIIAKQEYEQNQGHDNQSEIDNEDMDNK